LTSLSPHGQAAAAGAQPAESILTRAARPASPGILDHEGEYVTGSRQALLAAAGS
jgi:hypothetical protein